MGALFETVERMWQANEAGDAEAYLSHVSEDAEWGMPGTTVRGKEAVREVQRTFRDAFPDFRHEVLDHVESGNKIALQVRVEGTHTGPLRTRGGGRSHLRARRWCGTPWTTSRSTPRARSPHGGPISTRCRSSPSSGFCPHRRAPDRGAGR